jgi:hypothetical protein
MMTTYIFDTPGGEVTLKRWLEENSKYAVYGHEVSLNKKIFFFS